MASERLTADELAALTWKASAFGGPHVHVRVESVDCVTCALLAEIDALRARVEKLETRLEITTLYSRKAGQPLIEVPVPPEERDSIPDGIDCRDTLIRGLREDRDALCKERDALRQALSLETRRYTSGQVRSLVAVQNQPYREDIDAQIIVYPRDALAMLTAFADVLHAVEDALHDPEIPSAASDQQP